MDRPIKPVANLCFEMEESFAQRNVCNSLENGGSGGLGCSGGPIGR